MDAACDGAFVFTLSSYSCVSVSFCYPSICLWNGSVGPCLVYNVGRSSKDSHVDPQTSNPPPAPTTTIGGSMLKQGSYLGSDKRSPNDEASKALRTSWIDSSWAWGGDILSVADWRVWGASWATQRGPGIRDPTENERRQKANGSDDFADFEVQCYNRDVEIQYKLAVREAAAICPRPCTPRTLHPSSSPYTSYACGTQRALRHEYSWSTGSGSLWAVA